MTKKVFVFFPLLKSFVFLKGELKHCSDSFIMNSNFYFCKLCDTWIPLLGFQIISSQSRYYCLLELNKLTCQNHHIGLKISLHNILMDSKLKEFAHGYQSYFALEFLPFPIC